MRLIPSLFLDNWHKQIEIIAGGQKPLGDDYELDPRFPRSELSDYTTQYIISKKERPVPGISDERLMKLVQRSDSKDVALAACMHLLSPQAIRTLIVKDFVRFDSATYLKLLLLARHGNQNAVGELDSERAKALLLAYRLDKPGTLDSGQHLKALLEITLKNPVPKNSLVYSALHTAIISACPRIASELHNLRYDKQWFRAWKVISWISMIPRDAPRVGAEFLDPVELLDKNLIWWRMWAAWEPAESKMGFSKATDEQRAAMIDYLALEGPDDSLDAKSNYCEKLKAQGADVLGQFAQFGTIRLKTQNGTQDEARELLDRLHRSVSHAFVTSQSNIDLLMELCLRKTITNESLDIMDAIAARTDLQITTQVLELVKSQFSPSLHLTVAKNLLPLLCTRGNGQIRSSVIGEMVVDSIMSDIRQMQEDLVKAWKEEDFNTAVTLELLLQPSVFLLKNSGTEFEWLSSLVNQPFMDLLRNWPTMMEITSLQKLRQDVKEMQGRSAKALLPRITSYLDDLLIQRGVIDLETKTTIHTLLGFWAKARFPPSRSLAVLLADGKGKFRTNCISQLHTLSEQDVLSLVEILKLWSADVSTQDKACQSLASYLASLVSKATPTGQVIIDLWKPVLYRMLKNRGDGVLAFAREQSTVGEHVSLFENIRLVFGDKAWNPKLSPAIMQPSVVQWADRLTEHLPVLLRLETEDPKSPALRCFLAGDDPWILEGILCHLALEDCWVGKTAMYEASYGISCLLTRQPSNAQDIYDVLCSIFQMSLGGAAACSRLLSLCKNGEQGIASVLLPGWLHDPSWSEYDQMGLKDTAKLLGLSIDRLTDIPTKTLEAVADYMDLRYNELMVEAKRLDYMRVGLKTRDRDGVAQILDENMIEDTTAMEDAFSSLPVELLNVTERVNDAEVEIIFPLTDLTLLQRAALGIGNAQSLLVRLFIGDYGSQPKFCIHLDNEPKDDSRHIHSQWTVFPNTKAPELPICHGTISPLTYQLARMLSRYLVGGFKDLLSIYTLVSTSLKTMGSACIVCGTHHGAILRRATICDALECSNIFSRAPLEIRLSDIRQDPMAVDMLITMVKSAIDSNYHNLLPNCPIDKDACLRVLRTLPSMESLAKSKNFAASITGRRGGDTEKFLAWVCGSFKGFLSTATGNLRIPSLPPGTLQFVLANAAPMKELTFASEFSANTQQSKVVFHGTSLDRLYLILHQGLRNLSGTPLQAYGAASGKGIYLADEPSTSWAYADRKAAARQNWGQSAIKMGRVLLGCEMIGAGSPTGRGVHVIQKEGTVMVRYIFVIPPATVTLPISGHVAPALMSVFNSLRSGAV